MGYWCNLRSWFLLRQKCILGRSLPPLGLYYSPRFARGCKADPRGVKTALGNTFPRGEKNFLGEISFPCRKESFLACPSLMLRTSQVGSSLQAYSCKNRAVTNLITMRNKHASRLLQPIRALAKARVLVLLHVKKPTLSMHDWRSM